MIAAPSGAGKTSLVTALVEKVDGIQISVSHTTRPARPGEVDGQHYHFISEADFQKMIAAQSFLEHAQVYSHHYGTSKEWVLKTLERGIDVILEIDWQGARQIQQLFPTSVLVFILPPSLEALKERLGNRQQDSDEVIEQRMAAAQKDIEHYYEFDYLVVNDQFENALADLEHIVYSHRLRANVQSGRLAELLAELLEKQ